MKDADMALEIENRRAISRATASFLEPPTDVINPAVEHDSIATVSEAIRWAHVRFGETAMARIDFGVRKLGIAGDGGSFKVMASGKSWDECIEKLGGQVREAVANH